MPIQIPESGRNALAALAAVGPAALDALCSAFQNIKPTLRQRDLVEDLSTRLKSQEDFTPATLREIARMLSGLYAVRADQNLEPGALAAEVVEAAQSSGDKRLALPEERQALLATYLTKLLSLDQTIGLSAKAARLAFQTPRHFHDARVLTDARPIYMDSPSGSPTGFLILHTLQFEYHEGNENLEWFLALDSEDLLKVRDAMDRALAKERSLRELLEKTELPILTFQDVQDAGN